MADSWPHLTALIAQYGENIRASCCFLVVLLTNRYVCVGLHRDIAVGETRESDSVMCCGHDPGSHITSLDFQPDGPLLVRSVYCERVWAFFIFLQKLLGKVDSTASLPYQPPLKHSVLSRPP